MQGGRTNLNKKDGKPRILGNAKTSREPLHNTKKKKKKKKKNGVDKKAENVTTQSGSKGREPKKKKHLSGLEK